MKFKSKPLILALPFALIVSLLTFVFVRWSCFEGNNTALDCPVKVGFPFRASQLHLGIGTFPVWLNLIFWYFVAVGLIALGNSALSKRQRK